MAFVNNIRERALGSNKKGVEMVLPPKGGKGVLSKAVFELGGVEPTRINPEDRAL